MTKQRLAKVAPGVIERVAYYAKKADELGLSYPIGRGVIAHRQSGRYIQHAASRPGDLERRNKEAQGRLCKMRERDAQHWEGQFLKGISIRTRVSVELWPEEPLVPWIENAIRLKEKE
jgi:hypothetical protein